MLAYCCIKFVCYMVKNFVTDPWSCAVDLQGSPGPYFENPSSALCGSD